MNFCIDAAILELEDYPPLVYVDCNSDRRLKDALGELARYFKREMRFDTLQYDETMYGRTDYVGFLLLTQASDLVKDEAHFPNRVVGGGVFTNQDSTSELDWVWLHPFFRSRGVLRKRWKTFQQKFGHFSVAPPLSRHMLHFVHKYHTVPPTSGASSASDA